MKLFLIIKGLYSLTTIEDTNKNLIVNNNDKNIFCANWDLFAGDNKFIPMTVNNISYMIYTDYYLDYPKKIKEKLRKLEYNVPDTYTGIRCNWYKISKAYNLGIVTGYIDIQLPYGNGAIIIDLPNYDNKVMNDLQTVLETTYPVTEITLIVFSIPLIVVFLCLCLY